MSVRAGKRLADGLVRFYFDGREIVARRGDTVAAALLANGTRLVGRSVKYRRPRGVFTGNIAEPNALVTVGERPNVIPNVPATCLAVEEKLRVRSQNRWPTLRWDLASLLQLGGGLFGAGFYYKTFMWPSWHTYEGMIRRLAGLGEAPGASNLPDVAVEHIATDIVIAGAGAAGLAAALCAARAGARVVLLERDCACGGELDFESATVDGETAPNWVASSVATLRSHGVRIINDALMVGESGDRVIAYGQPGTLRSAAVMYHVHARCFIRATGAIERPIAFVNNDLPGVMLAGAAETYLARYGVRVGSSVLLFGNHDRLYATAARLLAGGVRVGAIVDTRSAGTTKPVTKLSADLRSQGVQCLRGHAVISAHGRVGVSGATVAPIDRPQHSHRIDCDTILVSGGWSSAQGDAVRESTRAGWNVACGAAAGDVELQTVVNDAWGTAARAARLCGYESTAAMLTARGDPAPSLQPFWRSPASLAQEKRQFVDLQNDVTVADLRQAIAEGFRDIEHVKRYTTLGIGTDQGATGGTLGAAIVAEMLGLQDGGVRPRLSRGRLPHHPVPMIAVCGRRVGSGFAPERRTAMHEWHVENGGVLEPAGFWMRPRYYQRNGSDAFHAGIAEAARVRQAGGIMDASTLGKIEIVGRDAASFLDSMYLSRASTIRVGRGKYMVNLREDGMVLDDGIVMRLAPDRFLATVSSGHADHMSSHFNFWREARWNGREVSLTDVTEAWSVIVVAGPASRETLRQVLGDRWHEPLAKLAHMDFVDGEWQGVPLRALRASFSGELAFELHCRPHRVRTLWQAFIDAGLEPYGLEALDILRIEKGYLVSAEINGQTTPLDLGMEAMLKVDNACIGRALLDRPAFAAADRPRLVGLRAADGRSRFLPGAQVTTPEEHVRSSGHVTSAVYSPALEQWIGLALIDRRLAVNGTELMARDPVRWLQTRVVVVPPVHFDSSGERMKA